MEGQAHAGEQGQNLRTVVGLGRGAEAGSGTVEQETTKPDPEVLGAMAEQVRLKQGA